MENYHIFASKHRLPDRKCLKHMPLKSVSPVKPRIDRKICQICLRKSEAMVNIFESIPEHNVPIAEMIALVTGHHGLTPDSFPENICWNCLQDATKAFKIKQVYEGGHVKEDSQEVDDLLEKMKTEGVDLRENREPHSEQFTVSVKTELLGSPVELGVEEGEPYTDQLECEVKKEPTDFQVKTGVKNYSLEHDEPYRDELECQLKNKRLSSLVKQEGSEEDSLEHVELDQCQVKNEPIEKDTTDEENYQISDIDVDQSEGKVKSEGSEDQSESQRKTIGSERPFKCYHCPRTFAKPYRLREHIGTHTGERPHKCSHCSSAFGTQSCLKRHLRTHTGERPFKCSHCPKSFAESYLLKVHIHIHTGEGPHKCSTCQKTFSKISSLQRHLRYHTGERPFQCSHCLKSYAEKHHLKDHILIHTGDTPYKCTHCSKTFTQSSSLQRHLRIHRGEKPAV